MYKDIFKRHFLPAPTRPARALTPGIRYEAHRGSLVGMFLVTLSAVSLVFGAVNIFYFELFWLGCVELIVFLVTLVALMDLHVYHRVERTAWIVVILFAVLSLTFYWLVAGAYNGSVWLLWFPMISFFLLGTRQGLFAYIAYCFCATTLLLSYHTQWASIAEVETLSNIFGSLLAFGVIAYFHERAKEGAYRQVSELATLDSLTGLANRRSFVDAATEMQTYGITFSLLLLDIDHFKRINDRYGHAVGDCALREVANRVASAVRKEDLVGRLGGEEFGVLILDCDHAEAVARAEEIKNRVAECAIAGQEYSVGLTVSIGVASSEAGELDFEGLFTVADRRLYAAKEGGRAQVVSECP